MHTTVMRKQSAIILALALGLASCSQPDGLQSAGLQRARRLAQKSEADYQAALRAYQELIRGGQDLERLHLELGRLYYDHGELQAAAREFKASPDLRARKYLAICRYRLGDYTEALRLFETKEIDDDEYRYYHGLTCERLNLFDRALAVYEKITGPAYLAERQERIEVIAKRSGAGGLAAVSAETRAAIAAAPPAQNYPQAGALILVCNEEVEVTSQDTQVSQLHYVVKILNDRGKEEFAETGIDYDSTFEKVELEYARTITPDGQVIEVGSRHIRDVSKYLNFPLYSNARVHIISFPGITEGAVIEYRLKVTSTRLIDRKGFVLTYPVQSSQPIIAASFSLAIPQERSVSLRTVNGQYNTFGALLEPRVESAAGRSVYRWQFKDIPQIIPESRMPPSVEISPTIVISSFSSWQEIYEWWWGLAREKISAGPAVKDAVRQLLQNARSDEEKAAALYHFCAQKIRYVAVEYGQAGYEPHRADEIFTNKYGDCKDQAILLVAMLREAGLTAWPVLIPTTDCYNLAEEFPAVLFNHAIAAVDLAGKLVFMDATAETCSFGDLPAQDQGRGVLICKDAGYTLAETPRSTAQSNLLDQELRLEVAENEQIAARRTIVTDGAYEQAQRYWLLYTPPQLIEETLREKIQEISVAASLQDYAIENAADLGRPVRFSYTFTGREYLTHAGKLRIMPQLAQFDTALVARQSRTYPVDFALLDTKRVMIEVALPRTLAVKYIPARVSSDTPWFSFHAEYTGTDNRVTYAQSMVAKKARVPVAEYPEFKSALEALAKRLKQHVILEEIK